MAKPHLIQILCVCTVNKLIGWALTIAHNRGNTQCLNAFLCLCYLWLVIASYRTMFEYLQLPRTLWLSVRHTDRLCIHKSAIPTGSDARALCMILLLLRMCICINWKIDVIVNSECIQKKNHNKHDFIDMHSANMISCVYENFVGCVSVYIFMT